MGVVISSRIRDWDAKSLQHSVDLRISISARHAEPDILYQ
jgi:hypothetical protein